MPAEGTAPIQDKQAVRVLAAAVGQREAARRLGLSENTVKSICYRAGDSLALAKAAAPTMAPAQHPNAPTPAEAMQEALADDSRASRIALSRGLRRTAEHIAQLPPDEALAEAQNVKATVSSLSTVHGWEAAGAGTTVNIALLVQ